MPSKLVLDRGKDSESVASIGDAQLDTLVRALSGDAAHKAVRTLVGALVDDLRARERAMREADEAHERELGDDAEPRDLRDEAASALRQQLVELRAVLLALYGAAVVRKAGFDGETPQDAEEVERLAGQVYANLEALALPKARLGVSKIDRASARAIIDAKRKVLRKALSDVAREGREAKVTLAKKNRAIDAFDRALEGTSRVLEGLLTLAGEDDLASSVRPRRGGASATEPDDDEDNPDEGAGRDEGAKGTTKPVDPKR